MRCKQMLSLSVVTVLLAASLAGCGTSSTAPSAVSSEAPSSAASSAASEVTETAALPDGVYTAEFDTDSGMFHANEACDGKGTLTVKDGKMTFHVSLVSKKIVNLYPGLAADAEAHKTDWLLPTTDTVTYSDGTSEEVYGYDIPVTALDEDFPLAILGSKGTWYDHTVSVRNARPRPRRPPRPRRRRIHRICGTGGRLRPCHRGQPRHSDRGRRQDDRHHRMEQPQL